MILATIQFTIVIGQLKDQSYKNNDDIEEENDEIDEEDLI